jgi:hypothetical protein
MRRRDLLVLSALAATLPLAARAGEETKKKSGGVGYIALATLTGTTHKAGGRRGVLTVDCGLQVDDAKLRDYADLSLPRLRAAYVQVVQTYAAGLTPGSEPNTDLIAQALQRQTDLILKRPGARLLLGAVVAN